LSLATGERKVLDDVYKIIMKGLGERRGRRPGPKTVQTKLRLPQPVYSALKKAAEESNVTLSRFVAGLAAKELGNQVRL
jgi:predicted DNA-binding ribbon-helix-helix protein